MYNTIEDIKAANRRRGHHWFDSSTMRFFSTRIAPTVYKGKYFITSEQFDYKHPRLYSIRVCNPDGSIDTVGEFQQYKSLAAAKRAVAKLD